jgi:hypothetical protein
MSAGGRITQGSHACRAMSDVTPRDLFTARVRHFRIKNRYYAVKALGSQEVMTFLTTPSRDVCVGISLGRSLSLTFRRLSKQSAIPSVYLTGMVLRNPVVRKVCL